MDSPLFEEFVGVLNRHKVRYLIIGAHALAIHVRPRATKDLDLLINPTIANARRLEASIREFFGGANVGFDPVDALSMPYPVFQLGVAPHRIDLLFTLTGNPAFSKLWKERVDARFGEVPAHYIGIDALIAVKRACNRLQDQADLVHLLKAQKLQAKQPKKMGENKNRRKT